jgi:AcrR family transcriptional regulator
VLQDRFPEPVAGAMRALGGGDRIAYEQYGDLIVNRKFRQTLLCHADRGPSDQLVLEALDRLLFAGREPDDDAAPDELLAKAVSFMLERRPDLTAFEPLRAALGVSAGELREALVRGLDQRLVSPHADPPLLAGDPGPRPRTSALARFQLGKGEEATTLWHSVIVVEEPGARALVRLLDGTRDHAAIRADLVAAGGPELSPEDLVGGIERLAQLGLMHPAGP